MDCDVGSVLGTAVNTSDTANASIMALKQVCWADMWQWQQHELARGSWWSCHSLMPATYKYSVLRTLYWPWAVYHNVIDGYLSRPTFQLAVLELRVQDLQRLSVLGVSIHSLTDAVACQCDLTSPVIPLPINLPKKEHDIMHHRDAWHRIREMASTRADSTDAPLPIRAC